MSPQRPVESQFQQASVAVSPEQQLMRSHLPASPEQFQGNAEFAAALAEYQHTHPERAALLKSVFIVSRLSVRQYQKPLVYADTSEAATFQLLNTYLPNLTQSTTSHDRYQNPQYRSQRKGEPATQLAEVLSQAENHLYQVLANPEVTPDEIYTIIAGYALAGKGGFRVVEPDLDHHTKGGAVIQFELNDQGLRVALQHHEFTLVPLDSRESSRAEFRGTAAATLAQELLSRVPVLRYARPELLAVATYQPESSLLTQKTLWDAYRSAMGTMFSGAQYDPAEVRARLTVARSLTKQAQILMEVLLKNPELIFSLEKDVARILDRAQNSAAVLKNPATRSAVIDLSLAEWESWFRALNRKLRHTADTLPVNHVTQNDFTAVLRTPFLSEDPDAVLHLLNDLCAQSLYIETPDGLKPASIMFDQARPQDAYFCLTDDLENSEYHLQLQHVGKSSKVRITPMGAVTLGHLRAALNQDQAGDKTLETGEEYVVRFGSRSPRQIRVAQELIADIDAFHRSILELQKRMNLSEPQEVLGFLRMPLMALTLRLVR